MTVIEAAVPFPKMKHQNKLCTNKVSINKKKSMRIMRIIIVKLLTFLLDY